MTTEPHPHANRTREIELELFKRVDARLERIEEKMDVRLSRIEEKMGEMNERTIRLDAQDVGPKVKELESRVRALEEWKSRVGGQIAVIIVPIAAAVGAFMKVIVDFLSRST